MMKNIHSYKYFLGVPYYSHDENMWIVTRYSDVKKLVGDKRLSNNLFPKIISCYNNSELPPIEKIKMLWLNSMDPPDHKIPRNSFDYLVSKDNVTKYEGLIKNIAFSLISSIKLEKGFDLISKFAEPFPLKVIMSLFKLDNNDYRELKTLLEDFTLFTSKNTIKEDLDRSNKATETLFDYFDKLI